MAAEFQNVTLEAEHVPEVSRTLEPDHTISEQELPGMVNVYIVFDGARLLLTQYKAGKVFDALAAAQTAAAEPQTAAAAAEPQTAAARPVRAPERPAAAAGRRKQV